MWPQCHRGVSQAVNICFRGLECASLAAISALVLRHRRGNIKPGTKRPRDWPMNKRYLGLALSSLGGVCYRSLPQGLASDGDAIVAKYGAVTPSLIKVFDSAWTIHTRIDGLPGSNQDGLCP